jgi:hypothetical protein
VFVQLHCQVTRSGMNPRRRNSPQGKRRGALSKAETTGLGFTAGKTYGRRKLEGTGGQGVPLGGRAESRSTLLCGFSLGVACSRGESAAARGSRRQCSEVLCCCQQSHGILGPSVKGIGMQPVASEPNHSVNLTRNSVPHWRGEARYAHSAPPRQRVTLSHSGYLKR